MTPEEKEILTEKLKRSGSPEQVKATVEYISTKKYLEDFINDFPWGSPKAVKFIHPYTIKHIVSEILPSQPPDFKPHTVMVHRDGKYYPTSVPSYEVQPGQKSVAELYDLNFLREESESREGRDFYDPTTTTTTTTIYIPHYIYRDKRDNEFRSTKPLHEIYAFKDERNNDVYIHKWTEEGREKWKGEKEKWEKVKLDKDDLPTSGGNRKSRRNKKSKKVKKSKSKKSHRKSNRRRRA